MKGWMKGADYLGSSKVHYNSLLQEMTSSYRDIEDRENAVNNRDLITEELTPDGLNEAQRLAREWDGAHPR